MPQQTMLLTASLRPDRNQPRKTRNPEKQRQLNESIALHGILEPLGVRADKITLVWGEGRLIAALANGLKEVPAVVLDQSMAEWEYQNLQLVENVVRSDISHFELWQGCGRLLAANPGWGLKDLARSLSYDASAMTRIMSPSKCIPAWQEALKEGKVGISDCYAASKLPESEQPALLAMKLAGASRDAIERAGRKKRNENTPEVRVNSLRCPLPSGTTVVIKGRELTLLDAIQALFDLSKAMKRASEEGIDGRTFARMCAERAAKVAG
jgi:ParB family chromosome partitioning protein